MKAVVSDKFNQLIPLITYLSKLSRSKLLNMPMPPIGEDVDDDLERAGGGRGNRRKPKVIGKSAPPTKMSEDGSDWGERCIDLYDIVDKVEKFHRRLQKKSI